MGSASVDGEVNVVIGKGVSPMPDARIKITMVIPAVVSGNLS